LIGSRRVDISVQDFKETPKFFLDPLSLLAQRFSAADSAGLGVNHPKNPAKTSGGINRGDIEHPSSQGGFRTPTFVRKVLARIGLTAQFDLL
jgi:hypothetical protein